MKRAIRKVESRSRVETASIATDRAEVELVKKADEETKEAEEITEEPIFETKSPSDLEKACALFKVKRSDILAFNDHFTEFHLITTSGKKFIFPKS